MSKLSRFGIRIVGFDIVLQRYIPLGKSVSVTCVNLFIQSQAVIVTKGGGVLVHGPTQVPPEIGKPWAALQALNVVIGLFSSLAVNMVSVLTSHDYIVLSIGLIPA